MTGGLYISPLYLIITTGSVGGCCRPNGAVQAGTRERITSSHPIMCQLPLIIARLLLDREIDRHGWDGRLYSIYVLLDMEVP